MKKKYNVTFNVKALVDIDIEASTYEEALEKARKIYSYDLIKLKKGNSFIDFNNSIAGICDMDGYDIYEK